MAEPVYTDHDKKRIEESVQEKLQLARNLGASDEDLAAIMSHGRMTYTEVPSRGTAQPAGLTPEELALPTKKLTEPAQSPLDDISRGLGRDSFWLGAPVVPSQEQQDQAAQLTRENEASMAEAIGLSWEMDTAYAAGGRLMDEPAFPVDPDFRLTEERIGELSKGIPADDRVDFAERLQWAQSEAQLNHIASSYKEQLAMEQRLATKGWSGVGVRLGVSVADPAALAMAVATSPFVSAAQKASRIRRIFKMAGIAGAENVALDRIIAAASERDRPEDALYALFGGLVLGGVAGSFGRSLKPDERAAVGRIADAALDELDASMARGVADEAGLELPRVLTKRTQRGELPVEMRDIDAGLGRTDAPAPRVDDVRQADELSELEVRAKELSDAAARAERSVEPKVAALRVLRAIMKGGEGEDLGSGVTVRRVPKEAKQENIDQLPPDVRALIDAHMTESGKVNRKMLRELEHDIDVLTKELKGYKTKSTHLKKLGELRRAKAKVAKDEQAKAAGEVLDERSVGAAQTHMEELQTELLRTEGLDPDLIAEVMDSPVTKFASSRVSVISYLKSSVNPWTRWGGGRMAEDAVGNVGDRAVEIGASEIQAHIQKVMETRFYQAANPAFKAWAKERGLGPLDRIKHRREFFEEVGHAIRSGGSNDPKVEQAANAMRGIMRDFVDMAKEARLAGFEGVNTNPNYMPRVHHMENVRKLDAVYGAGQIVEQLIVPAIMRAQPEIAEELAKKIAKGYWARLQKLSAGLDLPDHSPHGISLDNQTLIRQILDEGRLPASEVEAVMMELQRLGKHDDVGNVTRAKHRLLLDETFETRIKQGSQSPDKPGQFDTVRFADLLENDAERVFQMYTRQMSGYIGLAKKFDPLINPGEGFSRATFDRYVAKVRQYAHDNHLDSGQLEEDVRRLNFLWNAVVGAPLEADPASAWNTFFRRVRDYNFIRVMGQVGFAQVAELGNVMMMGGVRNVMRHVPEVRSMFKRAHDGKLDDDLARELEELFGLGTDWMRSVAVSRWDELDYRLPTKRGAKVGLALDVGRRTVAAASGLVPSTVVMQRITMKAIAQKFVNMASGSEKINPKRMAALGLDQKMLDRIFVQLKKSTVKDGKVLRLNVEQWVDDKEALSAFTYAGFRLARRIVQENDVGAMATWMHSGIAKVFLQFRSFMIQAYEKQLLHNIAMNDFQGYAAWTMSMVFGLSAYIAQSHLNALGMNEADRKRFLGQRLSTEKMAAAAFQRAGASTFLPMAAESVWRIFDDEPVFMGRSTQLASDFILGNPSADALSQSLTALKGLRAPLRSDYRYSRQDFRALKALLPFQNMVGVTNVGSLIASELPTVSSD